MPRPSRHRPLLTLVAAAVATAGGAAILSIGRTNQSAAPGNTPSIETSPGAHAAYARAPAWSDGAALTRSANQGAPVFSQSMIDLARSTSWDEPASAALEHFLVATFDADADGSLNDLERITAVQTLRDAMWPRPPADTSVVAWSDEQLPDEDDPGPASPASLTQHDRRLLHDVDQARRLDRQELAPGSTIDAEARAEIARRFRLDDDARLTPAEFARYMAHRNAGSAVADLNDDNRIDDADLRLFLDVARPIDAPDQAP